MLYINDHVETLDWQAHLSELPAARQAELLTEHPALGDFVFFTIECIPNFELHSLLYSYGQKIVVISPDWIRKEIKDEALKQVELYNSL